jgi:filamentous hemagglutinin family protein
MAFCIFTGSGEQRIERSILPGGHMQRTTLQPRQTRGSSASFPLRPLAALVPVIVALASASANAAPPLPSGGNFVAGSGAISSGAQSVTVNQTTSRGVIDWSSFSIDSGKSVNFNNGKGATLNRVTGGDPSTILGNLNATGSVYLINPQGVLVGSSGVVATGGRFVASTLNVGNDAFMAGGPLTFTGNGTGTVVNLGKIGSSGGDVILVSRRTVLNQGSIDAPNGTAELAAGSQVLLQDSSSGQQVFVQTGSRGNVTNSGAISAAQANLQAADGNIYALAGNTSAIRATGTATRDGHVWLVADNGGVRVRGTLGANNADGNGGTVETRAKQLDVTDATVQAGNWTLGAPTINMGSATAATLARNLGNGTSVDVEASGDLTLNGNVQWSGNSSLTLGATHSVTIAPTVTLSNAGGGGLTLRADSLGIDNASFVRNRGTIDWSQSTGLVNALYDFNGSYTPGTMVSNTGWTAAPYSGQVSQITAYQLVNNTNDLRNVSLNLAGNYALGKNIDASSLVDQNGASTFAPIGLTSDAAFTGQFDGFGHTIDKLRVSDDTAQRDVGLFGVIGATGVVRDINVTNATVTGFSGSNSYGVVAGRNNGTIAYANSSGSNSNDGFGTAGNGGLVGVNGGIIERSSSSADVGYSGPSGGLVGVNTGTIAQSFATGDIGAGSHGSTGGLVSYNSGTITQSYATGGPGGVQGTGSLVNTNASTGVIDESFALGGVGGGGPPGDPYGGIASVNQGTINSNVYWDKDKTGQSVAAGQNTGTMPGSDNALSTAQMSTPSSFAGWNFGTNGVWTMPAGGTNPVLQWQQAQ